METSPDDPSPEPDDFDRRLWQIASGSTGEAAFKEPSAAERARRAVHTNAAGRMSWRKARTAARLRKPVPQPSRPTASEHRTWVGPSVRARSARHRVRP